jgi:hypothetical protein
MPPLAPTPMVGTDAGIARFVLALQGPLTHGLDQTADLVHRCFDAVEFALAEGARRARDQTRASRAGVPAVDREASDGLESWWRPESAAGRSGSAQRARSDSNGD